MTLYRAAVYLECAPQKQDLFGKKKQTSVQVSLGTCIWRPGKVSLSSRVSCPPFMAILANRGTL